MNDIQPLGQYSLMMPANSSKTGALAKPAAQAATNSTTSTPEEVLKEAFGDLLKGAINGLTGAAAQMASSRMAEFVEDRSRLKAFAELAGWTSASGTTSSASTGTTSSSSSTASSASSGTSGTSSSDPITSLITTAGQQLLASLQKSLGLEDTTTSS